jgi:hypothetical protein
MQEILEKKRRKYKNNLMKKYKRFKKKWMIK